MRRTVAFVALWVVAAAGAVTVAWQGVGFVGDQVTDERPAPLAASEIEARLAEPVASAPTTAGTSDVVTTTVPSRSGGTPPATAGPAPTPTTGPPPAAAPPEETRTYNLQGGTAALRFTPDGVTVVFANPANGFTVSVEPEHGNGVKVEFESPTHESRVDGWWDNGPMDRTREEAESG